MKRWMIALLPLLTAARLPYGPVTVYNDSTAVFPDSGAATVRVSVPADTRTGEKFWVRVGTEITDADVRNISGSLFYDSLLVRPTGRLRDNGETSVGFLTSKVAPPGECATFPSGTNAAIRGISWSASRGQPIQHLAKVQFEIEFMALVAGSADFGWTPEDPSCDVPFVEDGEFDRKNGIIWSVEDDSLGTLYYVATANDTVNYATVDAAITITGASVTAAQLWPNNPGNYESYVRFTPSTLDVTAPATAKVAVEVWLPYPLAAADSFGISVVYERNKMTLSRVEGRNGWSVSPARDDFSDYADYIQAGVVDTTYTSICGLDSAAVRMLWLHPLNQSLQPKGQVMELQFSVTTVGGQAKLGCWFGNVPDAVNASDFPPMEVYMSTKDRSRREYPLIERELSPYVWKWRRATSATFLTQ